MIAVYFPMVATSQFAFDPASPVFQQLRSVLVSAGYLDAGIATTIDDRALAIPDEGAPATTINTLVRLFFARKRARARTFRQPFAR